MKEPLLYRAARAAVAFVFRVYFRRLEVDRAEPIPENTPIILAANHPQSITDALVLGLAYGRMVHYLAHGGLFRNPFKRWFLRSTGVIPVYRKDDAPDAAERNVGMFDACYEVLDECGVIGIFPEGTSGRERRVQQLKTGTARIALQYEAARDWNAGVVVVPAGITFESRRQFRSRVLVSFGEPIRAADFREDYERDVYEGVRLLTARLDIEIRNRVVDISDEQYENLVSDIERVYKGELLSRAGAPRRRESDFLRGHSLVQEIPKAITYFLDNRPDTVASITVMMSEYQQLLKRFRMDDETIRDRPRPVRSAAVRLAAFGILGFPMALYGAVWNGAPYKLTGIIAHRAAPDLTKVHFYQIVVGAVLYLLWYPPLLYLAWQSLGTATAVVFALSLAPTGFFARWYTRFMRRRRDMLRLAWLQLTNRYDVVRLRARRRALINAMDRALTEYLIVRAGGVVGGREAPEE